jgi:site-specific DNA-methyltransferase (adenine-specific)
VTVPAVTGELGNVPDLIRRERAALAEIVDASTMADTERRAAAIAELSKRAGLAVPVQNEAVFLRAEALERLAVLVDETRNGYHHRSAELRQINHRRVSEGRRLARTGARAEAEAAAARSPEKPVSMSDVLRRAERREREQRLRAGRAESEAAARAAISAADEPPYELVVSAIADWRPVGVAAIVTDPPYLGDPIPLYRQLRDFALDTLPAGGPLVVMTGHAILPAVVQALDHPELAWRRCITWRYGSREKTPDHHDRVFGCWKPMLVYHRGAMPADATMFWDEITSDDCDKAFHPWGQSLAGFERLVRDFSESGDVVCDPFLGGGTTAVAALSQARRFVGCDVDPEAVETTRRRLAGLDEETDG